MADPKQDTSLRVQAYLYQNKSRLQMLGVDQILWDVRLHVPNLLALPDNELRATIAIWRSVNGPLFSPDMPAPLSPGDSELVESVKKAVALVAKGVDLKRGAGRINIGVTGLTGELKSGDSKIAAKIGWTGTLGLEAKSGDFHLRGDLSADRWSLTLSYPDTTVIPDLTRVGKVFDEGAAALGAVVGATWDFVNLQDATRVKNAVTPHLQGAKNAMTAVEGIARAKPNRPNFGFTLGSPDPFPGQTGMPQGIQGVVTLTVVF